ncbi:MAG: FecR domain-containing protein [Sedimentisphaerales bacterium]|nr:FecR domain-containing protein [Sedimentisphaerales bacterium]
MTDEDALLLKVARLLFFSIDGSITDEQFVELESLLQDNPVARDYYLDLLLVTVGLDEPEGILSLAEREGSFSENINLSLWQALAEQEVNAPAVASEKPTEKPTKPESVNKVKVAQRERTVSKFSIYTFVFSAVATLCIVAMVLFIPISSPIAVLTDVIGGEWANTNKIPRKGELLRPGALTLSAGFAELAFDSGAVVVIEAPAIFDLERDNVLFLRSGKLSAVVPKEAVGFTVQTVNADIVDYGTEFGVAVDDSGLVAAHVFKGKVKVSSVKQTDGVRESSWLTQDEAVSVDSEGVLSRKYVSHEREFVRKIETVKSWRSYLDVNLIQNPGFEKNAAGDYRPDLPIDQQITNVAIQDWVDDSVATVYTYNATPNEEFPRSGYDPVPDNCGRNFFVGVDDNEIYQDIDVSNLGYLIDGKGVSFTLSGWLGGYENHKDSLLVFAVFRNDRGEEIFRSSIGPVDPLERKNKTRFVFKTTSGDLPADTENIRIILRTKRGNGIADAYADNLEIRLSEK